MFGMLQLCRAAGTTATGAQAQHFQSDPKEQAPPGGAAQGLTSAWWEMVLRPFIAVGPLKRCNIVSSNKFTLLCGHMLPEPTGETM